MVYYSQCYWVDSTIYKVQKPSNTYVELQFYLFGFKS
jgi:hypothetical protein